MPSALAPTLPSVAQDMLQAIVEAIADRPEDTRVQREARARDVVHSVQGFQPRDPVEIMLAGLAVTHVHLIQDSARDALYGPADTLKARTKSTIVALDRMMIGILKELRTAQARECEEWVAAETSGAPPEQATPAVAVAEKPQTEPTKPKNRPAPPASTTAPESPVPLLPALRRAETAIPAMMAVLEPPTRPFPPREAQKRQAAATEAPASLAPPPVLGRAGSGKQDQEISALFEAPRTPARAPVPVHA